MDKINPLLLEIPEQICTDRLDIRVVRPGDGAAIHEAVAESIEQLRPWMPWAQKLMTVDEQEAWCRQSYSKFLSRQDIALALWLKGSRICIGCTGMHRIDWSVPSVAIGYWLRTAYTGKGYITEAVHAVTTFAFDALQTRRVEVFMDIRNERSRRVAERCGFQFEGILRHNMRTVDGKLRDTRVYAKVRGHDAAS